MKPGWTTAALGDVCLVTMGQAPPGTSYNDAGRGHPLLAGAGDFKAGRASAKKFTSEASKVSQVGDIVVGIRATIGEKVWADRAYCLGRGVAGLRPLEERLNADYLWHWLTYAKALLASKGRGATFLQVNRSDITSLEVPLPPIEEQRRIAAILDHVNSLCGRANQAHEHVASAPLMALRRLSTPGLARLGDLAEVSTGSTPSRSVAANFGGGIPWVKSTEVVGDVIRATSESVSPQGRRAAHLRLYPSGSIIVAMYGQGATRGRAGRLGIEATVNQACAVVQPNLSVSGDYLYWQLKASYEALRSAGRGGNQPNLNLQLVRDFAIPLASKSHQDEFARVVRKCAQLQRPARNRVEAFGILSQSVQARAFSGRL